MKLSTELRGFPYSGAETDAPEGSRYVAISESAFRLIIESVEELEANQEAQ